MPKATDTRAEVFTSLFAESRDALHRYIRRFVGSTETRKEIVQEAFLHTYRDRTAGSRVTKCAARPPGCP